MHLNFRIIGMLGHIWHWLQEVMGVNIGIPGHTPRWYNFFSGFGSDFGEITLITGLIAIFIHTRCHVDGCYRHGKYPFQHYKLCKRDHPDVPQKLTHLHIAKLKKVQRVDSNSRSPR